MKRSIIILMLSASTTVSPVFASTLFHKIIGKKVSASHIPSNSFKANKDSYTDFSGDWVGSCVIDGEPNQDTLSISNDASELVIDGEYFRIGNALSTKNDSTNTEIIYEHKSFEWNRNKTTLDIEAIFVYKNFSPAALFTFNASGSMRLIDNQLVINMEVQDNINFTCRYNKQ